MVESVSVRLARFEVSYRQRSERKSSNMTHDVMTVYEHIEIDKTGVPHITGTTMKVVELVSSHLAYGWSPEELRFQYPHLTLGEIYAALAYYWDHKAEMDEDMERRERYVDMLRSEAGPSELAARLRVKGYLA